MPAATLPRDEVVSRILTVFREYGYEGASLARLSEATGLGRSSLYHYFPHGKDDMAAAALAAVADIYGERVIAPLFGATSPKTRLKRFAAGLSEFYQNGEKTCLTDLFTIGEAGALFQQQLGERVKALIGVLAKVAEQAGIAPLEAARRAENAVIAVQGSLVVSRALGTTAPFLRVIKEFPELLIGD